MSASSGRCPDVSGNPARDSATDGAQAQIWDRNGQAGHRWTTSPAP
ncbi:hypothetical protein [Microbispora sp. NPDC049125]